MTSLHPSPVHYSITPTCSYVFYFNSGFDYLTIRPNGSFLLGGGWARGLNNGTDAVGTASDASNNIAESAYLMGLLPVVFEDVREIAVEAMWTGIMGFSVDGCPWVGPVKGTGGGREWVCAGFSGEGMVNAWGCGRALAAMVRKEIKIGLRAEDDEFLDQQFPEVMRISAKRLKKSTLGMFARDYLP
jgi:glycine/D-amino acid oxidase-like deaminating enzyme